MFEAVSHLCAEAEALAGRNFDPLDERLISWMEDGQHDTVILLTGFLGSWQDDPVAAFADGLRRCRARRC